MAKSGRDDQYYNKNRNRFYEKAGHMIEIEETIGTIRILEVGTTLERIGIELNIIKVTEETLRIETGHITEVEAGIEVIEEDLAGTEETVDLEIEVDQLLGTKVKTEGKVSLLYKGVSEKQQGSR